MTNQLVVTWYIMTALFSIRINSVVYDVNDLQKWLMKKYQFDFPQNDAIPIKSPTLVNMSSDEKDPSGQVIKKKKWKIIHPNTKIVSWTFFIKIFDFLRWINHWNTWFHALEGGGKSLYYQLPLVNGRWCNIRHCIITINSIDWICWTFLDQYRQVIHLQKQLMRSVEIHTKICLVLVCCTLSKSWR